METTRRWTAIVGVLLLASLWTAPAGAQCEIQKLLPRDGAATDHFGVSVAISGPIAIVGAYQDDDNGGNAGSAYFFDTATGRQIAKLLPNDGAAEDRFGVSVAIGDNTAIVGAYQDDDNGGNSGSAYFFDTTTGQQIAKLLPNDGAAGDWFGFSVAISGRIAIVGAPFDDDNGSFSGSAYLFDTARGRQIAKLLANDGALGDNFGHAVAISGTTAIVGAWHDDENGPHSGSAYLFDATTGQQIAKLLPNDGAAGDNFGQAVAISGSTAIVGAPSDDDNGILSGSAYLIDAATGRQIAKLLPNDGAAFDQYGNSVAISGITAIVGAPSDNDNGSFSGSAYLFDATTGRQIAKLLPNDGAAGDNFGQAVAISGFSGEELVVVGVWNDDDNGNDSGSAYLFDVSFQCPADLDCDNIVGVLDLLTLLMLWGTDPGGLPDFNGDGTVDVADLLVLLSAWGPCS